MSEHATVACRRDLLKVRHLSVVTVLAQAAVLLSVDQNGRTRRGAVARRLSGIHQVRAQGRGHADYWRGLAEEAIHGDGPLWVVLGDSSAQGIGTADPADGYVGRVGAALARRDGGPWRMVNLSSAGALAADVLAEQLPALARLTGRRPDLVSCGVGANDLLRTPPHRLRRQLDAVAAALSPGAVLLTLPDGLRGRGRPYARWLNAGIRASALRHAHRVAAVDLHFRPPWRGKFSGDGFHPSAAGYSDWADAVLDALSVDIPDDRDAEPSELSTVD